MIKKLKTLAIGSLLVTGAIAQVPQVDNLYDIAYKGTPVVVDAELSDWKDANWIFLSQDSPRFVEIQGIPSSPSDFSAFFAMKMDEDNVYFAIRVRDEGVAMVSTVDTPNLSFNYDHLSVYLGLYDIGQTAYSSPHLEQNFKFIDPVTGDSIASGRTYRIKPGTDNTTSTLGPDYQLLIRAIEMAKETTGDDVITYNGALVDTTIQGTTAAASLTDDEKGYILEWKVPFSSLAGKIAKKSGAFKNFEWPLFVPEHGKIIIFDADVTDNDDDAPGVLNRFLRIGQKPALWRDSKSFGMRGRIVDLSQKAWDEPRANYYISHKADYSSEMAIDADLSDWADASWMGISQDSPLFELIQGVPESPSDFSGYLALKMDNNNLYAAVRMRDEGVPMNNDVDPANLSFNHDHLSLYLGLYDIGERRSSPHTEGAAEGLLFFDPDTTDAIPDTINAGRTYRIAPGYDNMQSTLGPDYQLLLRNLPYEPETEDVEVIAYNGALVDTLMFGTTAAGALTEDDKGYIIEWKIPFSTLAGKIAKYSREYRNFEWPLFQPSHGATIAFDADFGDRDSEDSGTLNRFLRFGGKPALWRDSFAFNMRGKIQSVGTGVNIESPEYQLNEQIPSSIELKQNYPNPFNPSTIIEYGNVRQQNIRLAVYNLLGQEVAVLVDGVRAAGTYQVQFNASNLSSGIYYYRLTAGSEVITRKMTLIK